MKESIRNCFKIKECTRNFFKMKECIGKKVGPTKTKCMKKQMYLYELYDYCRLFAHAQITDSSTKTNKR